MLDSPISSPSLLLAKMVQGFEDLLSPSNSLSIYQIVI